MMGKMRQFRRALRSCVGQALSYQLQDGWGATLVPTLESVIRCQGAHDSDVFSAFDEGETDKDARAEMAAFRSMPKIIAGGRGGKSTAIVSVHGIAMYDLEFQPYAYSSLLLSQVMKALAADADVGTIVLDINSPGGMVTGTQEAVDAIFAARKTTRVVALVNPLAASAAYHVASQADEIVAVPSATVGSIGVFMMHADCSAAMDQAGIKVSYIFAGPHKVEGNQFEALSDDAREHFQAEVDTIYADFLKNVARGRGVSVAKVKADFGGGRTLMAKDALAAGMIDKIATVDVAFSRWGIKPPGSGMDARSEAEDDAANVVETNPAQSLKNFLVNEVGVAEEDIGGAAVDEAAGICDETVAHSVDGPAEDDLEASEVIDGLAHGGILRNPGQESKLLERLGFAVETRVNGRRTEDNPGVIAEDAIVVEYPDDPVDEDARLALQAKRRRRLAMHKFI